MKKLLMILAVIVLLVGCNSTREIDNRNIIKVITPNGIPLVALGDLMGDEKVEIENVSGPELLISALTTKNHDIVIAPLQLGAKLYISKASNYQVKAILSFGNTYIVSREKINSLADLQGQDIMAYGKNTSPDIILRSALKANDVEANITYQNSVDLIIPEFVCNTGSCVPPKYILSAEPVMTKLKTKFGIDIYTLDLQEVLKDQIEAIPQAAVFVNPNSQNQKEIADFLDKLKTNTEVLNQDPQSYAERIVDKHSYFTDLGVEGLKLSIPRSNIEYVEAKQNQKMIEDYFNLLNDYNENLLGNKIPDLDFYK